MKHLMLYGLAAAVVLAAPATVSFAQSAEPPDFDSALLALASPGTVTALGGAVTEAPEGPEAAEAAEAPEGPESPGDVGPDVGPNVDHQFEGEETGENGNGPGN